MKAQFICYVNEEEVIVCTPETEPGVICEFFGEDNRDIRDYDRKIEYDIAVSLSSVMKKN